MSSQQKHIIGGCHWKAYFDSKANAFQLQSEISNWSNYDMLRELNRALDEICPPDKRIVIDTLEVDLGVVNYNNLHNELSTSFSENLKESLRSLLNPSSDSQSQFKIVEQDYSYLNSIESFLRFGVFPWNHETNESLHEILNFLLTNHRVKAIKLIRSLIGDENVRKRIAWQFKEETIQKIVKELEPTNYKYIIDFSDELIKVQEKEAIVQTSISDFKKNLWFWIFNYLFVERGTLFNRIEFVKSTLQQMALHYNIEFKHLFELVEEAVLNVKHDKANEFISILKIVSSQKENNKYTKKATKKQKERFWSDLKALFNDHSARSLSHKKDYFNELITNLYASNESRFRTLLFSIDTDIESWTSIVNDLRRPSVKNIFSAFQPNKADEILTEISSLEKLNFKEHFSITKEQLTSISLSYISDLKSNSYNRKTHLNYILKNVKKNNSEFEKYFLNTFFKTNSNYQKTKETLETYQVLNTIYKEKIAKKHTSFSKEKLIRLLKSNNNEGVKKVLLSWLKSHPKQVWSLLIKEDKYVPFLISKVAISDLNNFLEETHKKYHAVLTKLNLTIQDLDKKEGDHIFYSHLKEELITAGFKVLKTNEKLTIVEFIFSLIDMLLWETNTNIYDHRLLSTINTILTHPKIKTLELSVDDLSKLTSYHNQLKTITLSELILEEIRKNKRDKKQVMKKLSSLISNGNISLQELQRQEKLIVNYAFLKQDFVKENFIANQRDEILRIYGEIKLHDLNKVLETIYWKSLSQYVIHKGDISKWEEVFKKAVAYKFPKVEEQKKQTLSKENESIVFEQDLIKTLEESPEKLKAQIVKSENDNEVIEKLSKTISVKQFNALFVSAVSENKKNYLKASLLILNAVENVASRQNLHSINTIFWKFLIAIIKGGNSNKLLRDLIDRTIEVLNRNTAFNKDILLEELVKKGIYNFISFDDPNTNMISPKPNVSHDIKECIAKNQINDLVEFLIIHEEIPAWFEHQKSYNLKSLLTEIITMQPQAVIKFLRKEEKSLKQFLKMSSPVKMIEVLEGLYANQSTLLNKIKKMYLLLGTISVKQMSGKRLQEILIMKVLSCWVKSKWNAISESKIWLEILWEINKKHQVTKQEFVNELNPIRTSLPRTLQVTLNDIEKTAKTASSQVRKELVELNNNIFIPNAGLVILNTYFKMLFSRLEMTSDNKFTSEEAQQRAVHYLQFIATGLTKTEEHLLVLNKILCGLEPMSPVKEEIEIPQKDKELIEGMIESSIAHWSAIGKNSVDGFRGNWLVRNGTLREEEDRWELVVEKRSYDILMLKSPFSFSIIKMPWMKKPLHVKWPF